MSGPTNPTEEYFDKGGWGFDGTVWRKLNLTWGYNDRWVENLGGIADASGFYTAATAAVPAGYVHVARCVCVRADTRNEGPTTIALLAGGINAFIGYSAILTQWVPLIWNGDVVLKAGDGAWMYIAATVVGDVISAAILGYKMRVA